MGATRISKFLDPTLSQPIAIVIATIQNFAMVLSMANSKIFTFLILNLEESPVFDRIFGQKSFTHGKLIYYYFDILMVLVRYNAFFMLTESSFRASSGKDQT